MFQNNKFFFPVIIALLVVEMLIAIGSGAVSISLKDMSGALVNFFSGRKPANIYQGVFMQLRLPRVLLCAITGAILSVSGVLLQGLFRNPIVEPGLIGTSAGAAFGASVVFVMAASIPVAIKEFTGPFLVPLFAFAGGLVATFLVYHIARSQKKISITSLLLVGIAINAIGLSFYLGINPDKLKLRVLILTTAMVSVATAFVGVISFLGLIVPHVLRLLIGSDNKKLLPAAIIMGALLLSLADLGARLLLAPAEIPIGIITSIVGAPVFVFLLKKYNVLQEKGGEYA